MVDNPNTPWRFTATAAVREAFDSNVYLQSQTPRANQQSLITSFLPQATVEWNPAPAFGINLTCASQANFFHSEPGEDFVAHNIRVTSAGQAKKTSYESTTSLSFIDGSSISPTWTGPGGAPATGGPSIRDRRDAAIYHTWLRVTQNFGDWFIRPVFAFYLHDFKTEQRSSPSYQNYVDRNELVGGLDLGRSLTDATALWTSYRFGAQNQAKLLTFPEEYDNTFHRLLFGLEGRPTEWLVVSIVLGPEFQHYGNKVPSTFGDHDVVNLFFDVTVTARPSKKDTFTVSAKQFDQPGFGGRSAYKDLNCELTWKHKFSNRWSADMGGRAYNTDFLPPVVRNDWVFSANTSVHCIISAHLTAELSYAYENGLTRDSNASGREYDRHFVSLGCKYAF